MCPLKTPSLPVRQGELTRQYLAGRREHHVLPPRLHLTISASTLLLSRMLASVSVNLQLPSEPDVQQGVWRVIAIQSLVNAGLDNGNLFLPRFSKLVLQPG